MLGAMPPCRHAASGLTNWHRRLGLLVGLIFIWADVFAESRAMPLEATEVLERVVRSSNQPGITRIEGRDLLRQQTFFSLIRVHPGGRRDSLTYKSDTPSEAVLEQDGETYILGPEHTVHLAYPLFDPSREQNLQHMIGRHRERVRFWLTESSIHAGPVELWLELSPELAAEIAEILTQALRLEGVSAPEAERRGRDNVAVRQRYVLGSENWRPMRWTGFDARQGAVFDLSIEQRVADTVLPEDPFALPDDRSLIVITNPREYREYRARQNRSAATWNELQQQLVHILTNSPAAQSPERAGEP
jgi:hypothetical protein